MRKACTRKEVGQHERPKDRQRDHTRTVIQHGKKAYKPIKIDRCNEKASTII